MLKIIKLRIPIALYSLFTRSNRRENYFITNSPSTSFIYQSSHMWNNCYRVSESTNIDFSSAGAKFKKIIKFALLSTQKLYENNIWCLSNYDIREIRFASKIQLKMAACHICVFRGHCPMIYSNQFITRKITYFNNYLATAAMVPFLSDFFKQMIRYCSVQAPKCMI